MIISLSQQLIRIILVDTSIILTSTDSLEQIFVLLIYIVSRISNNYHFFQFICALIINANIGLALYLVEIS